MLHYKIMEMKMSSFMNLVLYFNENHPVLMGSLTISKFYGCHHFRPRFNFE